MMKKRGAFAGVLILISADVLAGEWTFEAMADSKMLYGYSDSNSHHSHHHFPSRFNVNLMAQYDFNHNYQLGAYLDLEYGVDQQLKDYNQGVWGEQVYLVFDSPYGKFIGGQTYNAAYQLAVGAPDIRVLGVNRSDIVNFVANPNWQRNNLGTAYRTLNSTEINTDGTAPKFTYISPDIDSFQFGLSIVPESYSRDGLISKRANYKDKAGYVFTAAYAGDVGNVNLSAYAGAAHFVDNHDDFSVGVSFYYKGWRWGGSVRRTLTDGDDAKMNLPNRDNLAYFDAYRDSWAYNAGLGYEIGPFKTALTYFHSKADGRQFEDEIVQFSNSYQYDKHMEFYAAVAYGSFQGETDEKGSAYIAGVGLKF